MTFTPENRARAEELVGRYPMARSALLPLLHLVQHQDGFVTGEGIAECAELLGLTRAEVTAVATFYTMYKRHEMGRHLVSVCTNFSCKVRGGQAVYDHLVDTLGVGHNGTTDDGAVTLEHAECLGNCEGAPVVSVDYLNYEALTPDGAAALVERVVAGEAPPPTRGMPPPGVRAVSHRLAGLGPLPGEGPAQETGAATAHARAGDAAPPAEEAGPGAQPRAVVPEFSEERERERRAAEAAVRESGAEPREVEGQAGPRAREFPTVEPDWEPTRPGSGGGSGSGGNARDPGVDDDTEESDGDEPGERGGGGDGG